MQGAQVNGGTALERHCRKGPRLVLGVDADSERAADVDVSQLESAVGIGEVLGTPALFLPAETLHSTHSSRSA
jgi:hypothetical protein